MVAICLLRTHQRRGEKKDSPPSVVFRGKKSCFSSLFNSHTKRKGKERKGRECSCIIRKRRKEPPNQHHYLSSYSVSEKKKKKKRGGLVHVGWEKGEERYLLGLIGERGGGERSRFARFFPRRGFGEGKKGGGQKEGLSETREGEGKRGAERSLPSAAFNISTSRYVWERGREKGEKRGLPKREKGEERAVNASFAFFLQVC